MRLGFLVAASVCALELLVSANQQALAHGNDNQAEKKQPVILEGHSDIVLSVAFTTDGKTLVAAGAGGTVSFWEWPLGKERNRLKVDPEYLSAFAMSRDGKTLATGPRHEVRVWEAATGQGRTIFKPENSVLSALALTADGKTLATAINALPRDKPAQLLLWDMESGKQKATLKSLANAIWSVAFSPDGTILAAGCDDKTVKLWDVTNGKEKATLRGHTDGVGPVAFTSNGKIVASAGSVNGRDRTIRLWDVMAAKEIIALKGHEEAIFAIAFSPDGKTLASVGDILGKVRLWDVATGKNRLTLKYLPAYFFDSVAFSPDGNTLAAGANERATKNGIVALWQLSGTGEPKK
jgi:WD40 repeat protein